MVFASDLRVMVRARKWGSADLQLERGAGLRRRARGKSTVGAMITGSLGDLDLFEYWRGLIAF